MKEYLRETHRGATICKNTSAEVVLQFIKYLPQIYRDGKKTRKYVISRF